MGCRDRLAGKAGTAAGSSGICFTQTPRVLMVHCPLPIQSTAAPMGEKISASHRSSLPPSPGPGPLSVLCGPNWVSVSVSVSAAVSASPLPVAHFRLGGRVNPAWSFASVSRGDKPCSQQHKQSSGGSGAGGCASCSYEASSQLSPSSSDDGRYAMISSPVLRRDTALYWVNICLVKHTLGLWTGPKVVEMQVEGPLASDEPGIPLSLSEDQLPDLDEWDRTNVNDASTRGPTSRPRRRSSADDGSGLESALDNSTDLVHAISEAFADLQAVRDEFTLSSSTNDHRQSLRVPPTHTGGLPAQNPLSSARTVRSHRDNDSDAGGSQASATIVATRPPDMTSKPALKLPSLDLVFPDPLAELGLAEVGIAEEGVSSHSLHSLSSHRRPSSRTLREHALPQVESDRAFCHRASRSPASQANPPMLQQKRSHRSRRQSSHLLSPQGRSTGQKRRWPFSLGVSVSIFALSAVALHWWHRTVESA